MHEDRDRGGAKRRLAICNIYEHISLSPTVWCLLNIKKFLHRKYILKKKKRWFLIICIKQVFHIHISAILYNVIWKRSIQYISNELNIIIWTPCRYQHCQHFIIFFQSDPTFGSSGASLAKLCHRANCGFPRIAPAWSTIFFNQ